MRRGSQHAGYLDGSKNIAFCTIDGLFFFGYLTADAWFSYLKVDYNLFSRSFSVNLTKGRYNCDDCEKLLFYEIH